MQAVVGETVKPEGLRLPQIRDIPIRPLFCGRRGGTRSVFLLENQCFWHRAWAPTQFRLTVDSPSAKRADQEAGPPLHLAASAAGLLSSRASAIASSTRSSQTN